MKIVLRARVGLLVIIAVAAATLLRRGPDSVVFAQGRSKNYVIDQESTAFHPQRLVVPRGATVVFENHDVTEHNVTLALPEGGKTVNVDLGTFPPGQKVSYTFEHSGTVRVHCSIHPEMTATIVVR